MSQVHYSNQHLSHDYYPKIAFAAMKTDAVIERTLLDLLSDARCRRLGGKKSGQKLRGLRE